MKGQESNVKRCLPSHDIYTPIDKTFLSSRLKIMKDGKSLISRILSAK
jgi:hypothetical protein